MAVMRVNGRFTRTIWPVVDGCAVDIIDQTALPHEYRVLRLASLEDAVRAICSMQVRGAPLIGVTAAYGLALALASQADDPALHAAIETLVATRPTAVNLRWALARLQAHLAPLPPVARASTSFCLAGDSIDSSAFSTAVGVTAIAADDMPSDAATTSAPSETVILVMIFSP